MELEVTFSARSPSEWVAETVLTDGVSTFSAEYSDPLSSPEPVPGLGQGSRRSLQTFCLLAALALWREKNRGPLPLSRLADLRAWAGVTSEKTRQATINKMRRVDKDSPSPIAWRIILKAPTQDVALDVNLKVSVTHPGLTDYEFERWLFPSRAPQPVTTSLPPSEQIPVDGRIAPDSPGGDQIHSEPTAAPAASQPVNNSSSQSWHECLAPLHFREPELKALTEAIARLEERKQAAPCWCLVVGEPGTGRTALIHEAYRRNCGQFGRYLPIVFWRDERRSVDELLDGLLDRFRIRLSGQRGTAYLAREIFGSSSFIHLHDADSPDALLLAHQLLERIGEYGPCASFVVETRCFPDFPLPDATEIVPVGPLTNTDALEMLRDTLAIFNLALSPNYLHRVAVDFCGGAPLAIRLAAAALKLLLPSDPLLGDQAEYAAHHLLEGARFDEEAETVRDAARCVTSTILETLGHAGAASEPGLHALMQLAQGPASGWKWPVRGAQDPGLLPCSARESTEYFGRLLLLDRMADAAGEESVWRMHPKLAMYVEEHSESAAILTVARKRASILLDARMVRARRESRGSTVRCLTDVSWDTEAVAEHEILMGLLEGRTPALLAHLLCHGYRYAEQRGMLNTWKRLALQALDDELVSPETRSRLLWIASWLSAHLEEWDLSLELALTKCRLDHERGAVWGIAVGRLLIAEAMTASGMNRRELQRAVDAADLSAWRRGEMVGDMDDQRLRRLLASDPSSRGSVERRWAFGEDEEDYAEFLYDTGRLAHGRQCIARALEHEPLADCDVERARENANDLLEHAIPILEKSGPRDQYAAALTLVARSLSRAGANDECHALTEAATRIREGRSWRDEEYVTVGAVRALCVLARRGEPGDHEIAAMGRRLFKRAPNIAELDDALHSEK